MHWSHRRGAMSVAEPEGGPTGGRPLVEVITIFITDNLTGDPGHPLSRVQKKLKYFLRARTMKNGEKQVL
jgi:hypothetical protein